MKDDLVLINQVLDRIPNKYMAMAVASKRAKELNMGVRPLVNTNAVKPTTIALYEIAAGAIVPGPIRPDRELIAIETDKSEVILTNDLIIDDTEEEIEEIITEAEAMGADVNEEIDEVDLADGIEEEIEPILDDEDIEDDEEV
ncbi:MAG: DNA-directed polymerase subunit omega [Candidatus Poribacteria bacterium]|nr:DNA-directed polymerase subunit omega [Candidatus Poribacteria bacterium]